jgi:hypothetical protein
MAKKAAGKNTGALPGWPLGLVRWHRIVAELDVADIAAAARATLAQRQAAAAPPPEPLLIDPQVWFDQALKDHPRQQHERKSAYARRLQKLMLEAPVARQWKWTTIRRRLYD